MLNIKILGSGCANCKKLEALTRSAVVQAAIEAQIEKVTEPTDIMKYNLLATPGLVINDKVVSAGRIPSETQIVALLKTALQQN